MNIKTVFITRCSTSCLKVLKRLLPVFLLLFFVLPVRAEGVRALRAEGVKMPSGQVSVSTRFSMDLPAELQDALLQGVTLHFDLTYEVTRPRLPAYKFRLNRFFSTADHFISYRLSYHPVTERYRVATGTTFYTEYRTLDAALRALGAVVNWEILPPGLLSGYGAGEISISVRLALSASRLPKPFQINILTSDDWNLDSGWVRLNMVGH